MVTAVRVINKSYNYQINKIEVLDFHFNLKLKIWRN